MQSAVHRDVI